eukprot:g16543.t1
MGSIADSEEGFLNYKGILIKWVNGLKNGRSWEVMLRLYRTLVRLLLEYCVQFWTPSYRKITIKLERIQKKFTRMLLDMEGLSYKERLDRLGLLSLGHRRLRSNLIDYKIMR